MVNFDSVPGRRQWRLYGKEGGYLLPVPSCHLQIVAFSHFLFLFSYQALPPPPATKMVDTPTTPPPPCHREGAADALFRILGGLLPGAAAQNR